MIFSSGLSGRFRRSMGVTRFPLLLLHAGSLDDLRPTRGFGLDERGEFIWRAPARFGAFRLETVADVRVLETADDFRIELHEYFPRGPGGRHDAVPRRRFIAAQPRLAHR